MTENFLRMKYILLFFLFITKLTFGQEIETLTISYYLGFDCSYEKDGEELRGACINEVTCEYKPNSKKYKLINYNRKEIFRPWDGGFQPNIIEDSIHKMNSKKSINQQAFDHFLNQFSQLKKDTIYPYQLDKIGVNYLENNQLFSENRNKQYLDSVLNDGFNMFVFSTVMQRISIEFSRNEQHFTLIKSGDLYWNLIVEFENETGNFKFYDFEFDRFLFDELPKNFNGKTVLSNSAYF